MSKKSPSMLTDCKAEFKAYAKDAKGVVTACGRSECSEYELVNKMEKFSELTIVALRAARQLKPEYPSDDHVKDYLHELVESVFAKVLSNLDAASSED